MYLVKALFDILRLMNKPAKKIQNVYLALILGNTLAASFIWGINTIFLLDAGLSNFEAFAANAFYMAGMLIFEVPTGVVADTKGRKFSYMLGSVTLIASTMLYVLLWQIGAPFWSWALVSLLLGLGFTFFSGATEAWLVDALEHVGYKGEMEAVFAKGQIVTGIAMLTGSVAGGVIAQFTNLGVPYIVRSVLLLATLAIAFFYMKDLGFTPMRSKHPLKDIKILLNKSVEHGLKNPPVKWLMLAAPFSGGVLVYAFYAMQPYLLELYGNSEAYSIAGLVAAIVAGAQILGGISASRIRRLFERRTSALLFGVIGTSSILLLAGLTQNFYIVLILLVLWGLLYSAVTPIRQAYLNSLIPSKQRATVLSFDSMMSSAGGVIIQPGLGKSADVFGYPQSYVFASVIQFLALPFLLKARKVSAPTDKTGARG
jgi:MFS family permease